MASTKVSLPTFVQHIWQHLHQATADKHHPFRTVAVATNGAQGPENRMMIMRQFEPSGCVTLFTDSRTAKVAALAATAQAALLWWSPRHRLQVRMQVLLQALDEATSRELQPGKDFATRDYRSTQPPGTPIADPPAVEWGEEVHFRAYQSRPVRADLLQLSKPNHLRAKGRYAADRWEWTWVVP